MSKKQKIWLAVFLAMFLIPEILWLTGTRGEIAIPWYPISNYEDLKNFLLSIFTTIIPFVGVLGLIKTISSLQIGKRPKTIFFILLIPLLFLTGFLSLMLLWILFFYFNSAPQIG